MLDLRFLEGDHGVFANVSAKPLNVSVQFYSNTGNGNAENAEYVQTTAPIASFLQLLPLLAPSLATKFKPLEPYLTTSLGAIFNTEWAKIQATEETLIGGILTSQAVAAKQSVRNVTTSLPSAGSVFAITQDARPANQFTSAQPPQLYLEFQLPGCNVHFESETTILGVHVWAYYKLNFDLAIVVSTPAPIIPFGFVPQIQAVVSNSSLQPDDVGASFLTGFDDVVTSFGNFVTQSSNYESDWNLAQTAVTSSTDGTYSVPGGGLGQILILFSALNDAGPDVASLGFSQSVFSIEIDGKIATSDSLSPTTLDTLTLTLTHPLDGGPVLVDPLAPNSGALSAQAVLSLSDLQVKPGQTITASGTNFAAQSDSQVSLRWSNTSSGKPIGAEIKYEITGKGTSTPIAVPLSEFGLYTYTAESLAANTQYSFWARCGDQLTWSKWSDAPLKVTTAKTSLVDLLLRPVSAGAGAGVIIGSADLSPTSTNWTAQAVIPSTAAGTYSISAKLSERVLATAPITVASVLKTEIFVVDTSQHETIIAAPVLMGGSAFTIKGENFPPGQITVTVDGADAGTPDAAAGQFVMPLKVPGNAKAVLKR